MSDYLFNAMIRSIAECKKYYTQKKLEEIRKDNQEEQKDDTKTENP